MFEHVWALHTHTVVYVYVTVHMPLCLCTVLCAYRFVCALAIHQVCTLVAMISICACAHVLDCVLTCIYEQAHAHLLMYGHAQNICFRCSVNKLS